MSRRTSVRWHRLNRAITVYMQKYIVDGGLDIEHAITQPSIYGVVVYFLLCHESLNYSIGQ